MNIVDLAESDLARTLESTNDFGEAFTLTNPAQAQANLTGQFSNISAFIDPDTGVTVSGEFVQVTARLSSIGLSGLGLPRGIEDSDIKPWLVTKISETFKIFSTMPDEKLGIITMILEPYNA